MATRVLPHRADTKARSPCAGCLCPVHSQGWPCQRVPLLFMVTSDQAMENAPVKSESPRQPVSNCPATRKAGLRLGFNTLSRTVILSIFPFSRTHKPLNRRGGVKHLFSLWWQPRPRERMLPSHLHMISTSPSNSSHLVLNNKGLRRSKIFS